MSVAGWRGKSLSARQEKQEGRREHPAPLLAGTAGVSRARFKYIIDSRDLDCEAVRRQM